MRDAHIYTQRVHEPPILISPIWVVSRVGE